ncbi:DUF3530 family protein [Alteromonadaceae bacterium BrNp21-10]|nr:DUF3530 family protein [Alteromonadaceae bacterium BrNp21-10]
MYIRPIAFCIAYLLPCLLLSPFAVAISLDQQFQSDIKRVANADEFDVILAGEREFIVLKHMADTPITKGVAILVNDIQHSPASGLNRLSQYLNESGWITLSLAAPELVSGDNPQAATSLNASSAEPSIAFTSFEQQQTQIQQQMLSAIEQSRQYPGFLLIIAQGTSAAWLSKLFAEEALDRPDGLVAIGAFWPQQDLNKQIPQFLAKSGTPVLDVYSYWDNQWVKTTTKKRKIAAAQAFNVHYRQRQLISPAFKNSDNYAYLSREIIGWVTHMGW